MRISKLCVCNNCNNLYIDTNLSDEQHLRHYLSKLFPGEEITFTLLNGW